MKIDNGNQKQERRHKHYVIPIIYMILELTVAWLILSIISVNFDINNWTIWAKAAFAIAIIYSTIKTIKVYKRQKNYKRKGEN
ncbi:MAG: hypothetical protein GXO60_00855 [Epsilonproteobacteria bacterium]|nr:hypothetical protein [Campylobacterota bacterium]